MKNIPSGMVTFLFTDIEGSTKLSQEFPDTLPVALEKHHSILSEAIKSNHGFIFEIVGDAFCAAFENASDAVKAAYDAQVNLAKEIWDDAVIKVRMGIHSGNVEWNGKRYMGYITLARSARVMSAAYGEQILVSNDAYELVTHVTNQLASRSGEIGNESRKNEIPFRDLGERRLKDVIQPIRLFQIISPSLREDFPPLKTLDARPNNLPVQLTSFIGREAEMKRVRDLLKQTHLLTLTGSGGSGKTRLALQVAADVIDDFANGVWFVELASLSEPALLPQAIMKVFGVKEEPKRSLEDTLCDYLRDKEILIILDNCEHLVDACSKLTEKLLSNSPKLKIIATSREALRCLGEQTHRTLSLEVPDPEEENSPERLSQYEAVRLFIERALSVDSTFRVNIANAPALAQICFHLDGIPLAIELAAARTKVLSVEQIYERLNDRFNLLTGGKRTALPRQQTLRALIDWSYELLSEKEKRLWRRFSVFTGGFDIEAAEEICSDENLKKGVILKLLSNLTEKSILIFDGLSERYKMLETIKQYGKELFKSPEEINSIMTKHLSYYLRFAESISQKLRGPEQIKYLDRLESEQGNFQSALKWSLEEINKEEGARLAIALGWFWYIRGYIFTGNKWFEIILENSNGLTKIVHSNALDLAGSFKQYKSDYEGATKLFEKSLSLREELGDKSGIAISLRHLGGTAGHKGEFEQAKTLFEKSLSLERELGEKAGLCGALNNLGQVETNLGNYEKAGKLIEESLTLSREIGDEYLIYFALRNAGILATCKDEPEKAIDFCEKALSMGRVIGFKFAIHECLVELGEIAVSRGEFERAREYFEESLSLLTDIDNWKDIAYVHIGIGDLEYESGNYETAKLQYEKSLELFRKIGSKHGISIALNNLGKVEYEQSEIKKARVLVKESLMLQFELGNKMEICGCLITLVEISDKENNYKSSVRILGAAESIIASLGIKLKGSELLQYYRTFSALKEKLDEKKFLELFEQGKEMTIEQAVKLALSMDNE